MPGDSPTRVTVAPRPASHESLTRSRSKCPGRRATVTAAGVRVRRHPRATQAHFRAPRRRDDDPRRRVDSDAAARCDHDDWAPRRRDDSDSGVTRRRMMMISAWQCPRRE